MQAPIIVFDLTNRVVGTVKTGPAPDKRASELLAAQSKQVATSGRPK